jgi:hypothetical protein
MALPARPVARSFNSVEPEVQVGLGSLGPVVAISDQVMKCTRQVLRLSQIRSLISDLGMVESILMKIGHTPRSIGLVISRFRGVVF